MALIPTFGILVTFKDRRASNPYREYPREILNAPESHTVYMVETDLLFSWGKQTPNSKLWHVGSSSLTRDQTWAPCIGIVES